MTLAARVGFALLVGATFAAFFVAQALKSAPPTVQHLQVKAFFSPNRDGRFDRARVSFVLKRADDVTATVINHSGDDVRVLRDGVALAKGQRLRLVWDGTDERHHRVPDGVYRVRLNLRRQGRSIILPRNIVKDTTPPKILITSIGPAHDKVPRPELLPNLAGQPARVSFQVTGTHKEVLVYRTDVTPPRPVFPKPIPLADDATTWTWAGTAAGRRVAAGTYLVIVRARDRAGNIGSSAPVPPRLSYGQQLPGRGGITVRYLTAQASVDPVQAGATAQVAVDSVGQRFTWTVRRVGSRTIRSRGHGTKSRLVSFRAPRGVAGLYLFEVHTRARKVAAPFVVQSSTLNRVLVVLPATTWQGENPLDDDGDGRPNTLVAGLPIRLARPYVKDGLPVQLRRQEAPLLAFLDAHHHRYDVTTDVALTRGSGPQPIGHTGVILAGDTRWLDPRLARALRSYVRNGGTLLSLGTDSLRRGIQQTPALRAIAPTAATTRDLFGSRLRPPVSAPVTLVNSLDRVGLFTGTTGQFPNMPSYEQTIDVGGGAKIVAAASTADGRREVIVASQFGKGLVIRPGLPEFAATLRGSGELSSLMERMWALVARS